MRGCGGASCPAFLSKCEWKAGRACKAFVVHTQAHVILVQELRVREGDLPDAKTWLEGNGWTAVFTPAQSGPDGGPSAGAAILARDVIGLSCPDGGCEVMKHRVVAASVEIPSAQPWTGYAGYFFTGVGPRGDNVQLLATHACPVDMAGRTVLPYCHVMADSCTMCGVMADRTVLPF